MIPLGIAGLVGAPAPQGVSAVAAAEGAIGFLRLFERALGAAVAAQVTDRSAPEGLSLQALSGELVSASDGPAGEDIQTVPQESPGVSGGRRSQTERGVDPALAILITALSQPQQGPQILTVPHLDRGADLSSPAIASIASVASCAIDAMDAMDAQVTVLPPPLPTQGERQTPPPADGPPSDLPMPMVEQPTISPAAIPVEIGTLLQSGVAAITPSLVQSGPLTANASTYAKPDLPEEGAIPSATSGRMSLSPPPWPSAVSEKPEAHVITPRSLLSPSEARVTREPAYTEISDPRTGGQPVMPFRIAVEAVRIEQPETTPGPNRVVDLPSQAVAAAPSGETSPRAAMLPPSEARVTREPAYTEISDPRTGGQPVTPFRGAVEAIRIEQLETTPGPNRVVDLPSQAVAAAPSGETSPRAAILSPSEARVTREPADAREALRVPPADADQPEGGQRSGDLLFTKDARLLTTSAKEVQDGISRSNGDLAMNQKGSLPGAMASMEGPARAVVAPSEETVGRSSLPHYSGVRFSTPSDPSKVLGSEVFDGAESTERLQVRQADGDRAVRQQGSSRPEATQDMQQDRSAFDSEGGSRSSDRSSPPSHDGRQIGADFALSTGPRAEGSRSGSAAPPVYTGSLVDQVAEQVAEAARMSLRSEGGQVHLRLHPKALGEMLIDISWKEGGIVAAIKVQSHAAGELLANDLARLRTALDKQGIPVSDLGVQVGLDLRHGSFEGNEFRSSPAIEYVREAIPWRDRESVLPNALSMKTESVIDITV